MCGCEVDWGKRKSFPIVSGKVEAIWDLIQDFEDVWNGCEFTDKLQYKDE